jgi:hypothetical protein
MKNITHSLAILLLTCSPIIHGCYSDFSDNYFEAFGINQPDQAYFQSPEQIETIRSATNKPLSETRALLDKISENLSNPTSPYHPEIIFNNDNFDYSVSKTDQSFSDSSFSIDDISCLDNFFDAKENTYRIDLDNLVLTPAPKTNNLLKSFIKRRDVINNIVCAKSFLNYFNNGSTYIKISITPNYEKNIASITTQTWTTKNPSYVTETNVWIAAAVTAATIAAITFKISNTQK